MAELSLDIDLPKKVSFRSSSPSYDISRPLFQIETTNLKLKSCGCKGIRSCSLCKDFETNPPNFKKEKQKVSVYTFCLVCQRACSTDGDAPFDCQSFSDSAVSKHVMNVSCLEEVQMDSKKTSAQCSHLCQNLINFNGVFVIQNFVTEGEEKALCGAIYCTNFVNSQSGRRKQDFGPKVNFKKKKLKFAAFTGLPSYSQFLYERMKQHKCLADFEPVELCNLEYCSERGAHIDPHFDDSWLWGERLITVNLLSNSTLTFTSDEYPDLEIRVPLPRLSLVVVEGAARHNWKHGISRGDVTERRVAMTFRELSDEFRQGGQRESDGEELLKIALTFKGSAVGGS